MCFLLDGEDLWELVKPVEGTIVFDTLEKQKKIKGCISHYQPCSAPPQSYIAMKETLRRYGKSWKGFIAALMVRKLWTEQFQMWSKGSS